MPPEITSREEALEVAEAFMERSKLQKQLIEKLQEDDMIGLECSETVQLERLVHEDSRDGWRLAKWMLDSVR